jgi:hypothetical protein
MVTRKKIESNFPKHGVIDIRLLDLGQEYGYNHDLRRYWEIGENDQIYSLITSNFTVVNYESHDENKQQFLIEGNGVVASLDFSHRYINVTAWASDIPSFDGLVSNLKNWFPEVPEPIDESVRLRFWFQGPQGPQQVQRKIAVPDWGEITDNYNNVTVKPLDDLIANFKPSAGGQLILWHGVPGTGKTYALRSLLKSWRKWCTGEYILDPEALFGHSPSYLVQLLLSGYVNEYDEFDEDETIDVDEDGSDKSKWRLLILEDTGELLSENAKDRAGQGLSRLLNLVDGLIGQGLKVLVLITTNEKLEKLHPAVSRDGRCLASIRFESLDETESQKWAAKNKIPVGEVKGEHTLSELFAKKLAKGVIKNEEKASKKSSLGFQIPPTATSTGKLVV